MVTSSLDQLPTADGGRFFVDPPYQNGDLLCRAGRWRQGRIVITPQGKFFGRGFMGAGRAKRIGRDECLFISLKMLCQGPKDLPLKRGEEQRIA